LLDFRYKSCIAKFTAKLYENDEIIQIEAQTKHIYSDFSGNKSENKAIFTPFIENLDNLLEIKNRAYVPRNDFV